MKIEEINDWSMTFLNTTAYRTPSGFRVGPHFKDSALRNFPLEVTSCHDGAIHKSWPLAQIRSFGLVSSTTDLAEDAKRTFIHRLMVHKAPQSMIDYCRSSRIFDTPERKARSPGDDDMITLWLPAGFHPTIRELWGKALNNFNRDLVMQRLWSYAWGERFPKKARVRVAWRNALPYLGHVLQRT